MSKKQKMMKKSDAVSFLFKVDMEGLSYAIENYAPENTGDARFEEILKRLSDAQEDMREYIDEMREAYDIEIC